MVGPLFGRSDGWGFVEKEGDFAADLKRLVSPHADNGISHLDRLFGMAAFSFTGTETALQREREGLG